MLLQNFTDGQRSRMEYMYGRYRSCSKCATTANLLKPKFTKKPTKPKNKTTSRAALTQKTVGK